MPGDRVGFHGTYCAPNRMACTAPPQKEQQTTAGVLVNLVPQSTLRVSAFGRKSPWLSASGVEEGYLLLIALASIFAISHVAQQLGRDSRFKCQLVHLG